ncbi:hypothetical protein GUJ93_ZPchr0012g18859 [Zizania palustris]|uniref:Uncharacterized protein n=1 Tax=Zizania palustris TaxID=103762 RepID=A0A8J6BV92_ZIZPA|nr:hypothetical protein GUJ93_ZPchr0012g18859 [Zizania palustris]
MSFHFYCCPPRVFSVYVIDKTKATLQSSTQAHSFTLSSCIFSLLCISLPSLAYSLSEVDPQAEQAGGAWPRQRRTVPTQIRRPGSDPAAAARIWWWRHRSGDWGEDPVAREWIQRWASTFSKHCIVAAVWRPHGAIWRP